MAELQHGLPPLAENPLDARSLIDIIPSAGVGQLGIAIVAERTGLTRAEFEQRFGTVENCYVQVFEAVCESMEAEVGGAYRSQVCWRAGLRAAAYAGARWLRDHPGEARFAAVEIMGLGPMAIAVREHRLERLVDLIDQGREFLDDPGAVGREVAVAIVGAIQGLLVQAFHRGRGIAEAEAFVPQLMYMAVRPYLGKKAALEELALHSPP